MRKFPRIGIGGAVLSALVCVQAARAASQAGPAGQAPAPAGFSKYADIKKMLQDLVQTHRGNARLVDVGQSDSGDRIYGIEIGSGTVRNLVVGTHHGNEYGSTEVALGMARSLADKPIPGQTVYVIPVLNISGYDSNNRYEKAGSDYFDPNRDYPGPCGTAGPFRLKSTKALADFVATQGIVASATLHTFYPAVVYPWGISSQDLSTPYDDLFKSLGQMATRESQYPVGNSTQLIYPADGTYEDFAFWQHGVWSMLFELGKSHSPSKPEAEKMVAVNVPGIRRLLENSPRERATDHAFRGRCDTRLRVLDRHDE